MPLTEDLKRQAANSLAQQQYREAALLYEQLIQADPAEMVGYWYSGLACLLDGQEAEAQFVWLAGMSRGTGTQPQKWAADLVEILAVAAQFQESKAEWQMAWLIRRYIGEFAPEQLNNLLAMVVLAGKMEADFFAWAEPALTQATRMLGTMQAAQFEPNQPESNQPDPNQPDPNQPDPNLLLAVIDRLSEIDPHHPFLAACLAFCFGDNPLDGGSQVTRQVSDRLVLVLAQVASGLFQQGRYDRAAIAYRQALALEPLLPPETQSGLWFNLGIVTFKQGNYGEAEAAFRAVQAIDPGFPGLALQRARVHYYLQDGAKGYQFTGDWFSRNIHIWEEYLLPLATRPQLNVLEIGSWEGRSTCWLLDHLLTRAADQITCVDTFAGGNGTNAADVGSLPTTHSSSLNHSPSLAMELSASVEARFDLNIARTGSPAQVQKRVGESRRVLRSLPFQTYDLIYIDGSHLASDTLADAVLCWELLKIGGLIVFDDYDYRFPDTPELNTGVGIDAFIAGFRPKLRLVHQSHQLIVEKLAD